MNYKVSCLIGVAIIETLISFFFFNQVFEKKKSTVCSLLTCGGLYAVGIILNLLLDSVIVNTLFYALINIIFSSLCFYSDTKKSVFYSILLDVFSTGLEILVIFAISSIFKKTLDPFSSSAFILMLESLFSKLLLFVSIIPLTKMLNKGITSTRFPKGFYFFPITTILSLVGLWFISIAYPINNIAEYVFSGIIILMFISTVIIFISYQNTEKKEITIYRLKAEIERIKIEQSHYEILKKQNSDILRYAHDAKNHLAIIKNLNDNPKVDQYIDEMNEELRSYTKVSHTGNTTFDVILNKYLYECEINEIKFNCDVRVSNLKFVENYDLIAILSNLLDNAIEAAVHSEKRTITLETDYRNNYAVIIISNSCDIPPMSNDNILLTTKSDKKFHGIGLKSVKRSLNKYNGDFSWDYDFDKKLFSVTVSFLNKNASIES